MTEFQTGDIVECVKGYADGWTVTGQFYRVESVHGLTGALRVGEQIIIANRFRLAFRPPAGEVWEPWNGGDAPTLAGVDVVFRSGTRHRSSGVLHNTYDWSDNKDPGGIIAYRVIPAEVPMDETEGVPFASLSVSGLTTKLTWTDRATYAPGTIVLVNSPGRVIAVHGLWAWVEFGGEMETVALADLIRAPS